MPHKDKHERSRSKEHKRKHKHRHEKHHSKRTRDEAEFKPIELDVTKTAEPANSHKLGKKCASSPKPIKSLFAEQQSKSLFAEKLKEVKKDRKHHKRSSTEKPVGKRTPSKQTPTKSKQKQRSPSSSDSSEQAKSRLRSRQSPGKHS